MYTKEKIFVVTACYEYDGFSQEEILGACQNMTDAFSILRKYDYKSWFTENVIGDVIFGEFREEISEDRTYVTHTYVRHAKDAFSEGSVRLTIAPTELVGYKF